jgi:hypothetical protein
MSETLVFFFRMYYLRASSLMPEGGDAPDLFAKEELLPS